MKTPALEAFEYINTWTWTVFEVNWNIFAFHVQSVLEWRGYFLRVRLHYEGSCKKGVSYLGYITTNEKLKWCK